MADDQAEEQRQQRDNQRQRRALGNALGAIIGTQTSRTYKAFTIEDAFDLQIKRIEGAGTKLRPNLLDRVDRIEQDLLKAVEELKQVPPEDFLDPDPDEDTNTPEDPA